jgi:hypothetical protein
MKKFILALSILLSTSAMADYKVIMSGKSGNIRLPEEPKPSFSTHTFTNCGSIGTNGPSQFDCTSEYNGSAILNPELSFSVANGIQSFLIPVTGTYKIEAFGAQGGSIGGYSGGKGAKAEKIISLTEGEQIMVLAGQMGIGAGNGAGGGGGSYVVKSGEPLVIAGGGGGATSAANKSGEPGLASIDGGDSTVTDGGCRQYAYGGHNGSGAGGGCAAGGAGWRGNGQDGKYTNVYGGKTFLSGGAGGASNYSNEQPHGGFGGGGGGAPTNGYGGGGGGYSGGGGGNYLYYRNPSEGNGGGGGSLGDNNVTGVNSGHGSVTITLIE